MGNYDKAYLKFYNNDGNPNVIKGFQKQTKHNILQKQNEFQSNKTYSFPDISKSKKYEYIYDTNIPNTSYNSIQNNNLIYKKPSINNNNENQIFEEIKNNDIIQEIRDNLKQNETKLERVNKTVQDIYINQNNEQNISKETKECYSQINEIEKIQQENLTLKADSIIYREDIMHLSEINRKLKFELDLAQKKIFDLISKGENINQILNKKNYELSLLTEAISNIKLTNSGEIMKKIKSNKTKEQQIFEYEFELNGLNNEKIKLETEIKNLEERYNTLLEEEKKNEKEEEFYKTRINENIFGLENKIKKMGKQMNDLSIINKQLKLTNQKYEQSINQLKNEKNDFIDKYTTSPVEVVPEVADYDMSFIEAIISHHLNPDNFEHCLCVQNYIRWAKRNGIANEDLLALGKRFYSDDYAFYIKLRRDDLHDREECDIDDIEDYEIFKKKGLKENFVFENEKSANIFIKRYTRLYGHNNLNKETLQHSLMMVININLAEQKSIGYYLLRTILRNNLAGIQSYYIYGHLSDKEKAVKIWSYIRRYPFAQKAEWALQYLYSVPVGYVNNGHFSYLAECFEQTENNINIF